MIYRWDSKDIESIIAFLLCQEPSDEKINMKILNDLKKIRDQLLTDHVFILILPEDYYSAPDKHTS